MVRKLSLFANGLIVLVLMLACLASPVPSAAAAQRLTRITNGLDGGAYAPVLSADGRLIVFSSTATNLVPGSPANQLYLFDRQTGQMELVSVGADGKPVDYEAYNPAISADGRFVAFGSNATNLAGELPGEVYLRDRQAGTTGLVSGPADGSLPDGDANAPAISATGRYVAFLSFATNLSAADADMLPDIYVRDMQANALTLVSVSSSGEKANSDSGVAGGVAISADGRYVAFQSYASNLVTGDTNDASDIFVRDLRTGRTERVSVSSTGAQANDRSNGLTISGNGRYVAFISWASNLVPGDTNGAPDVFVRDWQAGKTERVSVSSKGEQQSFGTIYDAGGFDWVSLSYDGRYVTFVSQATGFEKGARINACDYTAIGGGVEPCANIYLRDRQNHQTTLLTGAGKNGSGNGVSHSPVLSADGKWLAFISEASNLVAGDANGQADVFVYGR